MNALVPSASHPGQGLMPATMEQAMRLAEMMATAKLVPVHLQGKPGDCLLVVEQSVRWGMSPFAVAQATSVIGGKLMFEGKLVSAAINASGILASRLRYDFDGEGNTRAVTISATLRGEPDPRTLRCTLAEARTTNGMWTKQPDQQLVYFSTRAWARRFVPEVMLGVYSPEDFDAATPDTFQGPTIEAKLAPASAESKPPRQTARQWLDTLRVDLAAATSEADVIALGEREDVLKMLGFLKNGALDELNNVLAEAYARVREDAGSESAEDGADGSLDGEVPDFPGDRP